MKKVATLALVLTLGLAAVATTGCSAESTKTSVTKVETKTTPSNK